MSVEADIERDLERIAEMMPLTPRETTLAAMLLTGLDGMCEQIDANRADFSPESLRAFDLLFPPIDPDRAD
jgi:hypothetical protein